ncbi:uncharacterized protein LOC127844840 [Dreissena polymorpha]|uniref:uncharacterized protein LOC127844840 n=1 Tax=Dreissena polymorpha TaxID=45954 RepID=UPI0022642674|nr:uncharacterized protein LOC127844840 [Dreissena polymorpha]
MATEFTEDSVKEFLLRKGGKVKNNELVIHFKNFLNDSARKDEMREKFKNYVNTLATIKLDENKEKILVLKKKYMQDSSRDSDEMLPQDTFLRAKSEPPSSVDRPDGGVQSSLVRSENVRSTSDLLAGSDSYSLASTVSSSSLSSGGQELEEDVNASIMSVKERAQHLNRMESETELRKISSTTNLAATGKKGYKKGRDLDGDDSSTSSMYSGGYMPLSPKEKEWLVKCSKSDYHLMNELLSKNPELAKVRDFTSV